MGFGKEFVPKSILYLKTYSLSLFRKDLLAGITVGIISLPLAMAFAIASGTTPERGLFTAIIAGFLISALGGSRVQIGGPTGAFVVLVYDVIQRNGYEGLAISTMMAGVLLVLFGLFRFGSWIKYVPHPLVIGFTTGLGLLIFSSQVKDFFGLNIGTLPTTFIGKWALYFESLHTIHTPTLALSLSTLGLILLVRRIMPALPWGAIAIAFATGISYFFELPVATIASKFGQIPHQLPVPAFPSFSFPIEQFPTFFIDAIAIAFLAAIESLLSAVIGDGMIGGRHKSNCELVGQGIANFASILFGGIPATGAIARTAANVRTGAQTPMAGMIHAITLLLIISFFSSLASQIPLAALASVLLMVAWNMAEIPHFFRQLKAPGGDVMILLTAFFTTVLVDITAAICLGMILASFIFMKRMSEFSKLVPLTEVIKDPKDEKKDPDAINQKQLPQDTEVYEIQGPFFFGAADIFQDLLPNFQKMPKILILRMRHVPWIDASGLHALKEFYHNCHKQKVTLILSGVHGQAEKALKKSDLYHLLKDRIFPHIDAAIEKAATLAQY